MSTVGIDVLMKDVVDAQVNSRVLVRLAICKNKNEQNFKENTLGRLAPTELSTHIKRLRALTPE